MPAHLKKSAAVIVMRSRAAAAAITLLALFRLQPYNALEALLANTIFPLLSQLLKTQLNEASESTSRMTCDSVDAWMPVFLDAFYSKGSSLEHVQMLDSVALGKADHKTEPVAIQTTGVAMRKGWRRRRPRGRQTGNLMVKPVPPSLQPSEPVGDQMAGHGYGHGHTAEGQQPSYHDNPNHILYDPFIMEDEPYTVRFLRTLGDVFTRWSSLFSTMTTILHRDEARPADSNASQGQGQGRDQGPDNGAGIGKPTPESQPSIGGTAGPLRPPLAPMPSRPTRVSSFRALILLISELQFFHLWNELIHTLRLLVTLLPPFIRAPIDLLLQFLTPICNLIQWLFGWVFKPQLSDEPIPNPSPDSGQAYLPHLRSPDDHTTATPNTDQGP